MLVAGAGCVDISIAILRRLHNVMEAIEQKALTYEQQKVVYCRQGDKKRKMYFEALVTDENYCWIKLTQEICIIRTEDFSWSEKKNQTMLVGF